jgi:DNA-binding transcriptional MerR regulator
LVEKPADILGLDLANVVASPAELPEKLYFRIGEVAKLTGLKQHVLRYWETEFPSIAPKKMGSNHRMYRRKDVELILAIKDLLYNKRFTIEGARKHLEAAKAKPPLATAKAAGKKEAKPLARPVSSRAVVSNLPMPKVQTSLFGGEEPEGSPEPLPAAPRGRGLGQSTEAGKAKLRKELAAILQLLED